jgi:hypothetical protein
MHLGTLTLATIVFYASFGFFIFIEKVFVKISSINNERSTIE